ncbi:hypothetical protein A0H81_01819 [Grifola frondosa]|uniref:Lysine-specific metallo-endopeptidase domain-containing protein n=1 Tax=Grifola frondosa TaxID=5627 RepID=A0A1C7MKS2_GRIFR|nr:hypothetical protein A0H81_01819 [Grifola frondosa]
MNRATTQGNGGTNDHAYGQQLAEALARDFPELAVMNADNHEYYAAGAQDKKAKQMMHTQTFFEALLDD